MALSKTPRHNKFYWSTYKPSFCWWRGVSCHLPDGETRKCTENVPEPDRREGERTQVFPAPQGRSSLCRLCSTSPATFHLTRRPLCGQDTSAGKTRGCCPGGRDPLAAWAVGGYPPTKLDSLWVLMGDLEGPTTASLPVTNLLPLRHLRLAPVKRCIYIFFGT